MKGTIDIPEVALRETLHVDRQLAEFSSLERLMVAPKQVRPIFSDSLLNYEDQKGRQAWATFGSFALQCVMLGVLLLLPLYFTQELPTSQLLTLLVAPPPPPPPPPAAQASARIVKQVQSDLAAGGQLRTPSKIPAEVKMITEEEAPPLPSEGGVSGGVPGGIPGGQIGGVLGGILSSTSPLPYPQKVQAAAPRRVRVSQGVTKGMLLVQVEPTYPLLARTAKVRGAVVLNAIIDKEGNIRDIRLISGHPLLASAAIEAVRQWHYRPYLLNGEPVEVETTVTVNFMIN
jgi:protein TonB